MRRTRLLLCITLGIALFVVRTSAQVESSRKPAPPDPAGLGRYRAENERMGPPRAAEKRVVFFGDSITDGWISDVPAFFAGRAYVDRGISAQTTSQMLLRFRQDVIALEPSVVVILAGTNDIARNGGPYDRGTTLGNLASMAELARAHGIRVVLCSLLPVFDYPWNQGLQPAPEVIALNAALSTYAAANRIIYLDYHAPMADARGGLKKELSDDGVHPNRAGYAVMGPLAEQAIAQALSSR